MTRVIKNIVALVLCIFSVIGFYKYDKELYPYGQHFFNWHRETIGPFNQYPIFYYSGIATRFTLNGSRDDTNPTANINVYKITSIYHPKRYPNVFYYNDSLKTRKTFLSLFKKKDEIKKLQKILAYAYNDNTLILEAIDIHSNIVIIQYSIIDKLQSIEIKCWNYKTKEDFEDFNWYIVDGVKRPYFSEKDAKYFKLCLIFLFIFIISLIQIIRIPMTVNRLWKSILLNIILFFVLLIHFYLVWGIFGNLGAGK